MGDGSDCASGLCGARQLLDHEHLITRFRRHLGLTIHEWLYNFVRRHGGRCVATGGRDPG